MSANIEVRTRIGLARAGPNAPEVECGPSVETQVPTVPVVPIARRCCVVPAQVFISDATAPDIVRAFSLGCSEIAIEFAMIMAISVTGQTVAHSRSIWGPRPISFA